MSADGLLKQLTDFFKAARHLWGRCRSCGELFRMSDAAISYGSEAPKGWLRRVQQQQSALGAKKNGLDDWQAGIAMRESDIGGRERDLTARQKNLDRDARARAQELLKDDGTVKKLIRQSAQDAVQRSRSTLLGKLFERLGPFLQRFEHDPRDVRPILDPIDYICFDGLAVERRVRRITFVEVKSGTSAICPTQRSILEAVKDGRIGTEIWQFGERGTPIPQQLLLSPGTRRALPSGERRSLR